MSRDPRATARACFTLARQGATEGERAAALNRGMAIIENNGLNPDEFDIPGREKARGGICPICGAFKVESHWRAPCYECSPSLAGRASGMRADRVIIDDPFEDYFGNHSEALAMMARQGMFRTVKPETATQKAEREREEAMSAHLAEERLRREVEELNERRRRATDEAVMRAFRGNSR